jgi:hypothetical protein
VNGRERFQRVMHYQPVDRVPLYDVGMWEQTRDRWESEGMPRDFNLPEFVVLEGNEFFGLDRQYILQLDLEVLPKFEEEVLEETERLVIKRNADGSVTKQLKEGEKRGMRLSMDQHLSHPVVTRADWEAIKWHFYPASPARRPQWWSDEARCLRDRDYPAWLPGIGSFGLYSHLRKLMGTENACTVFYDDPALAHEMLDYLTDFCIAVITPLLKDVQFDYFSWFEDMSFKNGPLVSPKICREFMAPCYRRVNDVLHAHGVDIIFMDTDGDPRVLIPILMDAGINGIYPNECASAQDVVALRQEYGRDLRLMGGIDKRALAIGREATAEELHRKLPPLLADGGYIPMLDHTAPPDISYANWMYYLDLKRRIIEGQA